MGVHVRGETQLSNFFLYNNNSDGNNNGNSNSNNIDNNKSCIVKKIKEDDFQDLKPSKTSEIVHKKKKFHKGSFGIDLD